MAGDEDLQHKSDGSVALCASCDRCRARKTKCDGKRPCSNCANKYMKKNKLTRCVTSGAAVGPDTFLLVLWTSQYDHDALTLDICLPDCPCAGMFLCYVVE